MQLTRRERQAILAGAALLALFVLYQAGVRPAMHRLETLDRVIAEKKTSLAEVRSKSREYLALRDELGDLRQAIASRAEDSEFLSFLEQVQRECGLERSLSYVKPSTTALGDDYVETTVQMKLQQVSLAQITQFLLRLQAPEAMLGVKALRVLKSPEKPELLDAEVQLSMLSLPRKT